MVGTVEKCTFLFLWKTENVHISESRFAGMLSSEITHSTGAKYHLEPCKVGYNCHCQWGKE